MSDIAKTSEPSPMARLAIDIGPLIVFFAVNSLAPVPDAMRIIVATGAFMVAMTIAVAISAIKFRHVSPILIFSFVMVVVLGGLTIWLQDELFIKIKPTVYYGIVAGLLFYGLLADKPILKMALGAAYPGLTALGWRILTRNWALLFLDMAFAHEVARRVLTTDAWVAFKLWFAVPATLVFAIANVPMLMKHGLGDEEPPAPVEPGPIE